MKTLIRCCLYVMLAISGLVHIYFFSFRLNNDLLLWEPMAPAPVTSQEQFALSQHMDLNVYNQLLAGDNFEMAKSGIQYGRLLYNF